MHTVSQLSQGHGQSNTIVKQVYKDLFICQVNHLSFLTISYTDTMKQAAQSARLY